MHLNRVKHLLIALLAVFALGAVATTTASAHRAFWICEEVAKGTGKFTENECKKAGTGNFESKTLAVGTEKEISGKLKAGTEATLKTKIGGVESTIKCKAVALSKADFFNAEPEAGSGKITGWDKGVTTFSSECKTSLSGCDVAEPIKVPPVAANGESVLVEGTEKKAEPIYEDVLPEENTEKSPARHIFAKLVLSGSCTGELVVKTALPIGKQDAAKEGEGGVLGVIEKAEEYKKTHIIKFVCPATPSLALNWKGEEINVDKLEDPEAACFEAEVEVSLVSGQAWDAK